MIVDGIGDEWQRVEPVWLEAGAAGLGDFESNVDIKQVYMANDEDHLFVFFRTSKSIRARYDTTPESGELCELYFDTDNDPHTGCKNVNGYDFGEINGYELKAWVSLGVYSGAEGSGPLVSYKLVQADAAGHFSLASPIESQSSEAARTLIAHGRDGVELAIPRTLLAVETGTTIRLLLQESVDPFAKERYSEGAYTIR